MIHSLLGLFALISAFLVISVTNPIHSVFFLILVFCNTAALLLLLQIDFLAMTILVVYVGAIAVLFLFVVMMLNVNLTTLQENLIRYLPVGTFVGIVFFVNSFILLHNFPTIPTTDSEFQLVFDHTLILLGRILYTHLYSYFIIASIILLVAMIGAIVLTAHPSHAVKRQDINLQLDRSISESLKNI